MLRDLKSTFHKLTFLLDKRRKLFLIVLFFASIFLSLVETAGISVIMPFISVATNPELIEVGWYNFFFELFSFSDPFRFIIVFGILIIAFYFFRSIYFIGYNYVLNRFSWGAYKHFAANLFKTYLAMPYKVYTQKNPSVFMQVITGEANRIANLLLDLMRIFSEAFTVLLLYSLMLMVNWRITLILTAVLIVVFVVVFNTIIRKSKTLGAKRYEASISLNKTLWGTFNNFKFIKLKSNETEIFKSFTDSTKKISRVSVISGTLGKVPRSILENIGFSLLIGTVCFIIWRYESAALVIPVISMYALALYRMLPGINNILSHFNSIAFSHKALNRVYEDTLLETDKEGNNYLEFKKSIRGEGLSFSYQTGGEVIKEISFEIQAGDRVAFVGESGSGKTTLIDIIIGVYRPENGNLYIDDVLLDNDNIRCWRRKIGYIPQNIYLFDGTIAENVSFGSDFNEEKIISALKKAKIWDFLQTKNGIHTQVGDRGIQLSGGQTQRVGIARALYDDPDVLVLDEATSALDDMTEGEIMNEIYDVSGNKTLIIIAHRLSTVERCNRRIRIGDGKIVAD